MKKIMISFAAIGCVAALSVIFWPSHNTNSTYENEPSVPYSDVGGEFTGPVKSALIKENTKPLENPVIAGLHMDDNGHYVWPKWINDWEYNDGLDQYEREAVILDWRLKHGEVDAVLVNQYLLDYDLKTLTALADGGDIAATRGLVSLYMFGTTEGGRVESKAVEPDHDKAFHYISESIIEGKSRMAKSLSVLAGLDYNLSKFHGEESDPFLDKFAALKVASLQGDRGPMVEVGVTSLALQGITLTDEQKLEIDKRAKGLHRYFEKKRIERGLGNYSTNAPTTISRHFDLLEAINSQAQPVNHTDAGTEHQAYSQLKEPTGLKK